MKRVCIFLAVFTAFLPAAGAQGSPRSFALAAALTPRLGLLTSGSADVGLAGAGLEVDAALLSDTWVAEAGVEAGTGSIGWQVLVPVRAGLRFGGRSVGVEALVEAAPGIALTRPILFMVGLGAGARVTLALSPSWELYASAGLRVTLCPAYTAFTGSAYDMLDAPVSLGVRWAVARP